VPRAPGSRTIPASRQTSRRQEALASEWNAGPRDRRDQGVSGGGTCGRVDRQHAGPGKPDPQTQTARESHGPPAP